MKLGRTQALLVAAAVLVVSAQLVSGAFLAGTNVRDLFVQASGLLLLACGMALVMLLGEIDVSVGSMVGLLAAVMGILASPARLGLSPLVVALAVVSLGIFLGLVNGFLVAWVRAPSIIVTLGMLTALRGVTEVLMGGTWITDVPQGLRWFGTGTVGVVPVPVLIATVVACMCWILSSCTRFGRRIHACGSSPEAARARGLDVERTKLLAFALLGALTGLSTLVTVPQLSVVESGLGKGWELSAVTAVVVGGVSVSGGSGSLSGVIVAVFLLSSLRTGLLFLKLGDHAVYWEQAVQGALILLAVLADRLGPAKRGAT